MSLDPISIVFIYAQHFQPESCLSKLIHEVIKSLHLFIRLNFKPGLDLSVPGHGDIYCCNQFLNPDHLVPHCLLVPS